MPVAEATPKPVYPVKLREYARRLHDQNGWSAYRIHKAMVGRRISPLPSESTIRTWVDVEHYEERLRRKRNFRPHGPRKLRTWELRLARMKDLRNLRLSYTAIAAVMSHDFEDLELTEHQVRSIFNGRVSNRTARRLLYPAGGKP